MNKKQWYESLFENYGEKYDQESFTQGTIGECDFLEEEWAAICLSGFWMWAAAQAGTPLN